MKIVKSAFLCCSVLAVAKAVPVFENRFEQDVAFPMYFPKADVPESEYFEDAASDVFTLDFDMREYESYQPMLFKPKKEPQADYEPNLELPAFLDDIEKVEAAREEISPVFLTENDDASGNVRFSQIVGLAGDSDENQIGQIAVDVKKEEKEAFDEVQYTATTSSSEDEPVQTTSETSYPAPTNTPFTENQREIHENINLLLDEMEDVSSPTTSSAQPTETEDVISSLLEEMKVEPTPSPETEDIESLIKEVVVGIFRNVTLANNVSSSSTISETETSTSVSVSSTSVSFEPTPTSLLSDEEVAVKEFLESHNDDEDDDDESRVNKKSSKSKSSRQSGSSGEKASKSKSSRKSRSSDEEEDENEDVSRKVSKSKKHSRKSGSDDEDETKYSNRDIKKSVKKIVKKCDGDSECIEDGVNELIEKTMRDNDCVVGDDEHQTFRSSRVYGEDEDDEESSSGKRSTRRKSSGSEVDSDNEDIVKSLKSSKKPNPEYDSETGFKSSKNLSEVESDMEDIEKSSSKSSKKHDSESEDIEKSMKSSKKQIQADSVDEEIQQSLKSSKKLKSTADENDSAFSTVQEDSEEIEPPQQQVRKTTTSKRRTSSKRKTTSKKKTTRTSKPVPTEVVDPAVESRIEELRREISELLPMPSPSSFSSSESVTSTVSDSVTSSVSELVTSSTSESVTSSTSESVTSSVSESATSSVSISATPSISFSETSFDVPDSIKKLQEDVAQLFADVASETTEKNLPSATTRRSTLKSTFRSIKSSTTIPATPRTTESDVAFTSFKFTTTVYPAPEPTLKTHRTKVEDGYIVCVEFVGKLDGKLDIRCHKETTTEGQE